MSRPRPTRWLLLRGLGREAAHWHELPRLLEAALGLDPGAAVCLDLPGSGDDLGSRAPLDVEPTVERLRERWSTIAGDHVWGLFGISFGAMCAIHWVVRYPADAVRVVAIAPTDRVSGAPWRRLLWSSLPLMARIALTSDLSRQEELVLDLTTSRMPVRRRAHIVAERVRIAHARPIPHATVARQLIAAARWRALEPIPAPLLVQVPDGDRMVDTGAQLHLAERLGADVQRHPWGGHDLPLDDPDWVCHGVAGWLER